MHKSQKPLEGASSIPEPTAVGGNRRVSVNPAASASTSAPSGNSQSTAALLSRLDAASVRAAAISAVPGRKTLLFVESMWLSHCVSILALVQESIYLLG